MSGQSGVKTFVKTFDSVTFEHVGKHGNGRCGFHDRFSFGFEFAVFFSLDLDSHFEHVHGLDDAGSGHTGDTSENKRADC